MFTKCVSALNSNKLSVVGTYAIINQTITFTYSSSMRRNQAGLILGVGTTNNNFTSYIYCTNAGDSTIVHLEDEGTAYIFTSISWGFTMKMKSAMFLIYLCITNSAHPPMLTA